MENTLDQLSRDARGCRICADHLALGPRPVFQVHTNARILVAGQAPGTKVHASGVPFDDASGDRLRDWMDIDRGVFYDAKRVAILPMGFCYPGRGRSGDLPPRPECAPKWRQAMLDLMPNLQLTLVIGAYAKDWHLPELKSLSLTEAVKQFEEQLPKALLLPHPSPRNNIWLKKNDWFEAMMLPTLKARVAEILGAAR
ncbi:uracil-DNA glycosylase family protein [Kordiimonas sp.]|uniref:uracil-DNA glycosylase family protein n=1 Tax=Kordiimonas sp. TaxID=1970157 RepID=UPI003A91161F